MTVVLQVCGFSAESDLDMKGKLIIRLGNITKLQTHLESCMAGKTNPSNPASRVVKGGGKNHGPSRCECVGNCSSSDPWLPASPCDCGGDTDTSEGSTGEETRVSSLLLSLCGAPCVLTSSSFSAQ